MKKLLAVLVVVALAIVAVGTADAAWIANTKHNMASLGTNSAGVVGDINEICIYCHTPHGGTQADGQPLWNRYATTSTFNPYTSLTMSQPSAANGATNPASGLCFSCHDGITSINSLRNVNGANHTGTYKTVSGLYQIGLDNLTNDHPIGMPIPTKTGYNTAPTTMGAYLVAGNVECSTCHAVHGAGAGAVQYNSLLRMDNAGSAMCLDCHDK